MKINSLVLSSSIAFGLPAHAQLADWYFGAAYTHETENHVDSSNHGLMTEAQQLNQSTLLVNSTSTPTGPYRQTLSLDESKAISLIAGYQFSDGVSLEGQVSHIPKTNFVATTYIGQQSLPHYSYLEGNYTATKFGLYGAYRKLLNNNFYFKSRVGVDHYQLSGKFQSITSNVSVTSTTTIVNSNGVVEDVAHTTYDVKTKQLNYKDINESKLAFAGGAGFGIRVAPAANLEVTYEATPLFNGVQVAGVFRF